MATLNTESLNIGDVILAANLITQDIRRYQKEHDAVDVESERHMLEGYIKSRTETRDKMLAIANDWDAQVMAELEEKEG